jgi:hypothetical protein
MKNRVEPGAKAILKGEDIIKHAVERTVDITCSTDDHDGPQLEDSCS